MITFDLYAEVYDLLLQIPRGKVTTYGALAHAVGDKRAARAVGTILSENTHTDTYPCYRVVYSSGAVGSYRLGREEKERRLQKDGIEMYDHTINLEKYAFTEFSSSSPLKQLHSQMISLSREVDQRDFTATIQTVTGIDTAYGTDGTSCTAVVTYSLVSKTPICKSVYFSTPHFPYISGYLSFREGPLILAALKNHNCTGDVLMIDGNGILHPNGLGLASFVGVQADIPTVGVSKSKIGGTLTADNYIDIGRISHAGYTCYSSPKIRRPVYVSCGHKISLHQAVDLVQTLSVYKEPEPTRQAHRLARKSIKERCTPKP
ncbi:MAG: endonuclease V [Fibrobacterota bacterium]